MPHSKSLLSSWLFLCCFMIFLMVAIGGLTRLTESGLSIVEWKPVSGTIPPLSEQAWETEFEKYKQSPEYLKINHGMSMTEFKKIFWMEYLHRLLGRLTGFVFFIPFIYFWATRQIKGKLALYFAGIFLLGGLQGAIGWYMVKSGLQDRPSVSHYRLTLHLFTALLLFALTFWAALRVRSSPVEEKHTSFSLPRSFSLHAWIMTLLILVQAVSGALVAGLHAGLIYNTFPLMNGQWIPDEIGFLSPWYRNVGDNIATVQFNHRALAAVITLVILSFFWRMHRLQAAPSCKTAVNILMAMLIIQISLGIATLLAQVPLILASLHQMGAVLLFAVALYNCHLCGLYVKRHD